MLQTRTKCIDADAYRWTHDDNQKLFKKVSNRHQDYETTNFLPFEHRALHLSIWRYAPHDFTHATIMLFICGTAPSKIVHCGSVSIIYESTRTIYHIDQKDHPKCTNFIEIRFNASESPRVCPTRRSKVTEITKIILHSSDTSRSFPYLSLGFFLSIRQCPRTELFDRKPRADMTISRSFGAEDQEESETIRPWLMSKAEKILTPPAYLPRHVDSRTHVYLCTLHRSTYNTYLYYDDWSRIFGTYIWTYEV